MDSIYRENLPSTNSLSCEQLPYMQSQKDCDERVKEFDSDSCLSSIGSELHHRSVEFGSLRAALEHQHHLSVYMSLQEILLNSDKYSMTEHPLFDYRLISWRGFFKHLAVARFLTYLVKGMSMGSAMYIVDRIVLYNIDKFK